MCVRRNQPRLDSPWGSPQKPVKVLAADWCGVVCRSQLVGEVEDDCVCWGLRLGSPQGSSQIPGKVFAAYCSGEVCRNVLVGEVENGPG